MSLIPSLIVEKSQNLQPFVHREFVAVDDLPEMFAFFKAFSDVFQDFRVEFHEN